MSTLLSQYVARVQTGALALGVAALVATAVGAAVNPRQFFFSYLFALLFWLGLSLGCLALVMIHHLAGGRWGYPTRRFLEAGMMTLPLMFLLFVPISFGLQYLYPWARPGDVNADRVLRERHAYANPWAFLARQILYFAAFAGIAARLRKWSLQQDATADAGPTRKARALSGLGVVVYGLLGTFAAIDWIMSLEAHWYSSLFGIILLAGQVLAALAFAIVLLAWFHRQPPLAAVVEKVHCHHLGTLLFTFVFFWTYVSFGQLLIIYSGDLPREVDWYLHRIAGNWKIVVALIAVFHFFVPFFLLLFRALKRSAAALAGLAGMLFIMQLVDLYWLVMPAAHPGGPAVSWMDFTAPLGIGGLWVWAFLRQLKSAPLLPRQDPGLQFSFVYAKP